MERFSGRFVSNTRKSFNMVKKHTFPVIEARYQRLEEYSGDWTCLPVSGLLDRLTLVVRRPDVLLFIERHAHLVYANRRRGGENAGKSYLQVRYIIVVVVVDEWINEMCQRRMLMLNFVSLHTVSSFQAPLSLSLLKLFFTRYVMRLYVRQQWYASSTTLGPKIFF